MQSAAPLFEILNGMTFEEFYGFGGQANGAWPDVLVEKVML